MKNKAFTLIELLAVIVILAIIALIATPIILGIINDARENSKKRSAELVYTGVEYAYTESLFKEGNGNVVDDVSLETIDKYLNIENVLSHGFDPSDTEKSELHIQTKDNVYCKVVKNTSTKTFDVSCGTDATYIDTTSVMGVKNIAYDITSTSQQVFKPQYYSDDYGGGIGGNPSIREETAPLDKMYYFGYDISDNAISTLYTCFIGPNDNKEYCLKAGGATFEDYVTLVASTPYYDDNIKVLDQAFGTSNCEYISSGNEYSCSFDGWHGSANVEGTVSLGKNDSGCLASNYTVDCYYFD